MDEADVRERLSAVDDPDLPGSILDNGLLESISIDADTVRVELAVGTAGSTTDAAIVEAVRGELSDLDRDIELIPTGPATPATAEEVLGSVENVIAVASGKGGVGKTTVAVNLAVGLAERGADVGLFDADVYGPNAPLMVDGSGAPEATADETLIPPTAHGVKVMSMAYLVGEDDPVIWRGPMVHKVITQLWEDVEWGELDYLIVDLPPGTGDTQLTLLQTVPLTGAVITTTPQRVALHDARKGLEMFAEHETNVLGIVENMAAFTCPDCGAEHAIFDSGGGADFAEMNDLPFLGSVPLDPAIREAEAPIVTDSEAAAGDAFRDIARSVANTASIVNRRRQG